MATISGYGTFDTMTLKSCHCRNEAGLFYSPKGTHMGPVKQEPIIHSHRHIQTGRQKHRQRASAA